MSIPEEYRQPSEDKWFKVIKALESNEEWNGSGFDSVDVCTQCGYCDHAGNNCENTTCRECTVAPPDCHSCCNLCALPVTICADSGDGGAFSKFVDAMNNDEMNEAMKQALIIYNYIRHDKEISDE